MPRERQRQRFALLRDFTLLELPPPRCRCQPASRFLLRPRCRGRQRLSPALPAAPRSVGDAEDAAWPESPGGFGAGRWGAAAPPAGPGFSCSGTGAALTVRSLWRNGRARWTSNPEVPGSSPGRDGLQAGVSFFFAPVMFQGPIRDGQTPPEGFVGDPPCGRGAEQSRAPLLGRLVCHIPLSSSLLVSPDAAGPDPEFLTEILIPLVLQGLGRRAALEECLLSCWRFCGGWIRTPALQPASPLASLGKRLSSVEFCLVPRSCSLGASYQSAFLYQLAHLAVPFSLCSSLLLSHLVFLLLFPLFSFSAPAALVTPGALSWG